MTISTLFPLAETVGIVITCAIVALFVQPIMRRVDPNDSWAKVRPKLRQRFVIFLWLVPLGLVLQVADKVIDPFSFHQRTSHLLDDWTRNHGVSALRLGAAIATVGFGFLAYYIRDKYQFVYGCIELVFSVGYALNSVIPINPNVDSGAITLTWAQQRLYWLGMAASIYIFVRGLDNIAKAKEKTRPPKAEGDGAKSA